ncbi:importin-13-like [Tubulanus polymorphus]|uniref:importin-13-like n=1 Tax=Tubulanus polymorphus TaxID=672921 RepID=UPI003DA36263
MEFTAENVEKTLKQFYCDVNIQREANTWLTHAQISPEAWTFSWQLLTPDKSQEVQFFGANCLQIKISRFWHEVPADHVPELRHKIFDKILQYANGPRIVLTRMCITLSVLTIQATPELWPNAVSEMVTTFQHLQHPQLQAGHACCILLELLTVLPEEFFTANLTKMRRSTVRVELEKGLQQVLPLLQNIMTSSTPPDIMNQAIRCFSAWVQFGLPMTDAMSLIEEVFKILGDVQLFDTAIECLVNVFSHPESYRYPTCVKLLLPTILQLNDLLTKSIESSDFEMQGGICRLIITIVECESKLLLECITGSESVSAQAMSLISLVLRCTAMPGQYPCDETCSEMTFGFWYILQDDIMSAADSEKFQVYKDRLAPVYVELVRVLLQKVKHPTDTQLQQWNSEEKEQFRCYRQDIADTMMYAYNILRQPLISFMCSLITDLVEHSKTEALQWQEAESAFFLLSSIAECVDYEENEYLPTIFKSLPVVPFNNLKLISTALQLIGAYSEWLNFHPDILASVIPLLLQGLNNTDLAHNASVALRDITRECREHMGPYVQQILSASQTALSCNALKSRESIRLMSSIGHILSVCPLQDIMQYLNALLLPHIQQLQVLVSQSQSATTKSGILLKMKMISGLFGSLNINHDESDDEEGQKRAAQRQGPQPVLIILQELFPLMQVISEKWITDPGVVEAFCDMFRQAVRSLMDDFIPLAADTCQMVGTMFNTQPYGSIVELCKQLFILYSSDNIVNGPTRALFLSVTSKTISLLESGQLREYTDVLDSVMSMLRALLKKCPGFFNDLGCNILGLYQTALYGLCLPEHHTFKSCCCFLTELLNANEKLPVVKEIIMNHGQVLLDRLLQVIGAEQHRGCNDHVSDTMQALNKNFNEYSRKWLNDLLSQDGYPSPRLTQDDKERFVKSVLRDRGNKRKLREIIKEFTMLCRGLIGTEYGQQTMASL